MKTFVTVDTGGTTGTGSSGGTAGTVGSGGTAGSVGSGVTTGTGGCIGRLTLVQRYNGFFKSKNILSLLLFQLLPVLFQKLERSTFRELLVREEHN